MTVLKGQVRITYSVFSARLRLGSSCFSTLFIHPHDFFLFTFRSIGIVNLIIMNYPSCPATIDETLLAREYYARKKKRL
jgi:hypothetical protein